MDPKYIWDKFKGLNTTFSQAIKNAEIVRSNGELSETGKTKRYSEIKDQLYNKYSEMLRNGIKACDTCIADKVEGFKICKLKNPKNDNERLFDLNFYSNIVEKMSVAEIVDFMLKDDNILNITYRDCFLVKADHYKKELPPMSDTSYKIDELVDSISFKNIDGIKEYQDIKQILQNLSTGLLTDYNHIYYNLENGDYEAFENVTVIFNLERPHFGTW